MATHFTSDDPWQDEWSEGQRQGIGGTPVRIVCHRARAPGLRLLGLAALKRLLDNHSFWAQARSRADLNRMLVGSQAVVSAWSNRQLIGFGRATSDGIYRAVLWDVVVSADHQGHGVGRRIVEALLSRPAVAGVERVYLMTTNSSGFYQQLGFQGSETQHLLLLQRVSGRSSG
ncbi:GNAT family N-acetyltransferase [Synechococcus sp. CS-1327]|nr:GNAT family N-acetyltransferase [Synechococcus sp. CS-1326]MCT0233942.1 GNAT family N-acetyltransferase [Synechococcus sp. CS-1327]